MSVDICNASKSVKFFSIEGGDQLVNVGRFVKCSFILCKEIFAVCGRIVTKGARCKKIVVV